MSETTINTRIDTVIDTTIPQAVREGIVTRRYPPFAHDRKPNFSEEIELPGFQQAQAEIPNALPPGNLEMIQAIHLHLDELIQSEDAKWVQAIAKRSLVGWFVCQIMRRMDGRARPSVVDQAVMLRRAQAGFALNVLTKNEAQEVFGDKPFPADPFLQPGEVASDPAPVELMGQPGEQPTCPTAYMVTCAHGMHPAVEVVWAKDGGINADDAGIPPAGGYWVRENCELELILDERDEATGRVRRAYGVKGDWRTAVATDFEGNQVKSIPETIQSVYMHGRLSGQKDIHQRVLNSLPSDLGS